MARRTTKQVTFRTRRGVRRVQQRRFIAAFVAAVLLVLAVSVFAILRRNDYNLRSAVGGEEGTTRQSAQDAAADAPVAEGEKTYLLWCAEKSTDALQFVWLLRCEMPARSLTALALAPEAIVTMDGKGETLAGIYAAGGARALRNAVQAMLGAPIDRYLGATDNSFINMVNYMGGLTVEVPEPINYRSAALTLVLNRGKQTLKGDTLYKYISYLALNGAAGRAQQAQALLEMCSGVCRPQNTEKRSRVFSKMMSTLITDLSIVDFSTEERAVVALTEQGVAQTRVARDLAAFAGE